MRNAPETVDDDLKALDDRLSGSGTPDWEELASIARRVLGKIGAGLIDQSPGQVSALKEIINRAEGKVGAGQRDEGPIGVVVLPALMDQDRLPYLDVDQEESIGERHNRMARQAARRESWEEARTIPGGGYRDEEYGGRA